MPTTRPTFSVVVPLYRTAKYLPDLLRSFEAQKAGPYSLEYIFVDDGSDDGSGGIAKQWLDSTGANGQVIRQENAGVSAARNRGIDLAQGEWITFPDSDDFLSPSYFVNAAAQLLVAHEQVAILSANVQRYDEASGLKSDVHPLRHKFQTNLNSVRLAEYPHFIQTQTASSFYRLNVIREGGLRFIEGMQVAEDAIFASHYLLEFDDPSMIPLKHSKYYYRKRASADSAADSFRSNPDFYFGRFTRGYIPLLEKAKEAGRVPVWLQNILLYDLSWLFPREMNVERKATHLTGSEKNEVLRLLAQVLTFVDEEVIIGYRITAIAPEVRVLMLVLGGKRFPPTGTVKLSRNKPGEFEISYLFTGPVPEERVESYGVEVVPLVAKTRLLDYFGQDVVRERILRLPDVASAGLYLDGVMQLVRHGNYYLGTSDAKSVRSPKRGTSAPTGRGTSLVNAAGATIASELVCWFKAPIDSPMIRKRGDQLRRRRYRDFIRNLAQTPRYSRKFSNAWLLMDKLRAAGDNAEYLYDYLMASHPEVNAWFVLEEGSPDWQRLKAKGFRLIKYRSLEHKIALQRAAMVASSHLDIEIVEPVSVDYYPRKKRPWRFVYLQHGVLQHNLAHWFNSKDIDLLTAASVDERDSIIEDGSTYRLTSESVVLTGFPRHDVVDAAASQHPFAERRLILIAPTWRNALFLPKTAFGAQRKLRKPFMETEFGQQWDALLRHEKLRSLAREHHAEIVFLPHPNFRGNMDDVEFPDYVRVINSSPDVHQLMSRAKVTVTDYSSIFFDAAVAGSRIVYFQFDAEEFLHGSHTYVPGYWNYDSHGFGPVAYDVDDAATQIANGFVGDGSSWREEYASRLERTLPRVDGKACQRIYEEVTTRLHV